MSINRSAGREARSIRETESLDFVGSTFFPSRRWDYLGGGEGGERGNAIRGVPESGECEEDSARMGLVVFECRITNGWKR